MYIYIYYRMGVYFANACNGGCHTYAFARAPLRQPYEGQFSYLQSR